MDYKDSSAFTILVREHSPMLLAYLRTMVSDSQAVDDLFQETMVTAWRQLEAYDPTRPFAAWIRGIARLKAFQFYRRAQRSANWLAEHDLDRIEARLSQIESRQGDTWDEKVTALNDCLSSLATDMKSVVELHYQEGLSTDAIATKLGNSREAIKKRLQRGRRWLFECLRHKKVFLDQAESPT